MTSKIGEIKPVDVVFSFRNICRMANEGMDVTSQVIELAEQVDAIDCSTAEGALALAAICRSLYTSGIEYGIKDRSDDCWAAYMAAERNMDRVITFLEKTSGKTVSDADQPVVH